MNDKTIGEPFTLQDAIGSRLYEGVDTTGVIYMQSTGLHDKNAKEMFESDICRWKSEDGQGEEEYIIVWNRTLACFELQLIGRDIPNSEIDTDVEVIGNIYENPDLLPKA